MEYLFACAIGPVQDFIATARRSRDLWFGSWMLSELSKAAADQFGVENLIFPAPKNLADLKPNSNLSVPNKMLAIVSKKPKKVGEEIREALNARLSALSENAFIKIPEEDPSFDRALAELQIEDLIEFYWSAVPYGGENQYPENRDAVEALLSIRKNTRNFSQFPGKEIPKSSLDGNRESVINEERYPKRKDSEKVRAQKAQALYQNYRAKPGERLSGVDLMKRLGSSPEEKKLTKFNSTSHFAALPFMAMIDHLNGEGKADELLLKIEKKYRKKKWVVADVPKDGALFYESRITDAVPHGEDQEDLRKDLADLLKIEVGERKPSPYFALLRADGDNMGLVIDAQKEPERHRDLSKALSDFAQTVPGIVERHQGRVIYAGGDDILAYLPIHTALDCTKKLDLKFKAQINKKEFFGIDPITQNKICPSLSVGLVIAHHLDPLSDILALSIKAEQDAKKVGGKNGLSIILSKRSGVDRTITGKWETLSGRMETLIGFYRTKAISKGTAYELQELHQLLGNDENLKEALKKEAIRVINRKKTSGNEVKVGDNVIQAFEGWIDQISLKDLALEMIIADTFASAYDMAGVKVKET